MIKSPLISIGLFTVAAVILTLIFRGQDSSQLEDEPVLFWPVQSIDTMKYSRDLAREKLFDQEFGQVIEQQISLIAETNATHVAIGTPYDPEFKPFLERWVSAARKHNLNVWFRGNWSGWEGWFEYPQIDRRTHTEQTRKFVENNINLFSDNDIFDPCPECENGQIGDPRQTRDIEGYRKFIIEEYKEVENIFKKNNKNVRVVFSMNGDVAKLVMDNDTLKQMGNIITIDHYVSTPEKLAADTKDLAQSTGAKIFLGEFGFPVPDLHGDVTPQEQKNLVERTLSEIARQEHILGINYWVSFGGTTALWEEENNASKPAVSAIKKYFEPSIFSGVVVDDFESPISNASITTESGTTVASTAGNFKIPLIDKISVEISAKGYESSRIDVSKNLSKTTIALKTLDDSPIKKFLRRLKSKFQ
jgi:hypothetical protein